MRAYDEAVAASVPAPPWDSNRDANRWYEQWCGQCRYDVDADGFDGEGCPLLMVSLKNRTPVEWSPGPGGWKCSEFRRSDLPDEPQPAPVLPGQLDILGVFVDRIVDEVSR